MSELEKLPDGALARTRANIRTLIDRYVPRHTREEVWEMERLHEGRVFDLLSTIHEYRERNQRMAERMDALEKEAYRDHAIPVSFGRVDAATELHIQDMSRVVSVRWSPDPYRMNIRLSDRSIVDERETPFLFEAVMRQFEEALVKDLVPKLRAEYGKLYASFSR